MPRKTQIPKEIAANLRQVEILMPQGKSTSGAADADRGGRRHVLLLTTIESPVDGERHSERDERTRSHRRVKRPTAACGCVLPSSRSTPTFSATAVACRTKPHPRCRIDASSICNCPGGNWD